MSTPSARPALPAFEWGVPGVSLLPPPPTRKPIPTIPTPWDALQFTLLGAYEFFAADLAFLASGASEDGHHTIEADKFFKQFHDLYDSLPKGPDGQTARREFGDSIRTLIFDLVTQWDRATGGTTMVIHSPGTTIPNAPLVPEHLKAHVYLPPRFIKEHPETHATITYLVQTYIEHIGIPTARDWRMRAKKIWPLTQRGHFSAEVDLPTTLVPVPLVRSALYVFQGHPWGDLKLEVPPPSLAQPSAPAADNDLDVYDIDDITFDNDVIALMDALERAEQLEIENHSLRDTIEDHQMLQQRMQADFEEHECAYQADLNMTAASVSRLEFFQHEWMERENGYCAELELLQSTVQRLEDDLRASRVLVSPRSPVPRSQRSTSQARPPAYTARLASPLSPPRVVRVDADYLTPHTDRFLAEHTLMQLSPMIDLIARSVPVVKWSDELRHFPALMPELVDGSAGGNGPG
ncbi:hypothetical protein B0H14DRAFT_3535115 [Mycena olivaceomarginata]|nr:hypothetical protein B0H14DRAFT_3535115 [Mycena olivaceomarginata]